jgi:hypothetical protein
MLSQSEAWNASHRGINLLSALVHNCVADHVPCPCCTGSGTSRFDDLADQDARPTDETAPARTGPAPLRLSIPDRSPIAAP